MYGKSCVMKANTYKYKIYVIEQHFWTPSNPTNEFWSRSSQANRYLGRGTTPSVYENADFIRIKDITLSYELASAAASKIGVNNVRFFLSGKNLFTITKWQALDPELDNQRAIPLQREFMVGANVQF